MGLFESKEHAKIGEEISRFVDGLSWLWKDEPLDGDQTEEISRLVLDRLDERNGNTTAGEGAFPTPLPWPFTGTPDDEAAEDVELFGVPFRIRKVKAGDLWRVVEMARRERDDKGGQEAAS